MNIYNKYIYNNGDLINISQGDNIRHGEVVPGDKHVLIDKEVMSNKFFHLLETNIQIIRPLRPGGDHLLHDGLIKN